MKEGLLHANCKPSCTKLQILMTCPVQNAQTSDITDLKESKILFEV